MKKTGLKKGMGMAMAAAMAMSVMVMPVSASAEVNNSMKVGYSAGTTYTLSIPAQIDLLDTAAVKTTEVGLSAVNTTATEKVQVKIKEGITTVENVGKVELTRKKGDAGLDTDTKVVSTVTGKDGAAVFNGFVVAEFQDMNAENPIDANAGELNFSAISNSGIGAVKAGTYTGTIVFEGAVVGR